MCPHPHQQRHETAEREIRHYTRMVVLFPDGNSALMLVYTRLRHVPDIQREKQEEHEYKLSLDRTRRHLHY